ncbi:MAG: O-antigen ligase family protein, partial [Spirochaetota bacterium]
AKVSLYSLYLFLLAFPLSVTISQGFAAICIFTFAIDSYRCRQLQTRYWHPMLIIGFLLYYSLLCSEIISICKTIMLKSTDFRTIDFYKFFLHSEISDVWMIFIIPICSYFYQKHRATVRRVLWFSFALLCLSGFIALFTRYRLADYVMDGFQELPGRRLQHYAGNLTGILVYLPIGFMNTHLTYGGLLGLFLPGMLVWGVLVRRVLPIWKLLIHWLLVSLALVLCFYNQSRSVWLGLIYVFFLLLSVFRNRFQVFFLRWKLFAGVAVLLVCTLTAGLVIVKKNWLLQRVFTETLKKRTTENQRYFIYRNTFGMIHDNMWLGVGAGRFADSHYQYSQRILQEWEQLWYELEITPRGHAHNDLLHFFAIGGLLALVPFVFFWSALLRHFFAKPHHFRKILFSGPLVFLVAGFFQCYMLDDEVVLPLYAFIGFFYSPKEEVKPLRLSAFFSFIVPTVVYILLIFQRNQVSIADVYTRKIWVKDPVMKEKVLQSLYGERLQQVSIQQLQEGFGIEGCLTHRHYSQPPYGIRERPWQLGLFVPPESENQPVKVRVDVWQRDAFDQDKLYKAHTKKKWRSYSFTVKPGENLLRFSGLQKTNPSPVFPKNIYFYDFYFYYETFLNKNKNTAMPTVRFGGLCDYNL